VDSPIDAAQASNSSAAVAGVVVPVAMPRAQVAARAAKAAASATAAAMRFFSGPPAEVVADVLAPQPPQSASPVVQQ